MRKPPATDIRQLLQRLAIPFVEEGHEHCRPGWLQLDCPYCSPGWKHWRLGYNLRAGYLNCWLCGKKSLPEVLVHTLGIGWREAKQLTSALEKVRLPQKSEH